MRVLLDFFSNSTVEENCVVDAVLEFSCTSVGTKVLRSASPSTFLSSASFERSLFKSIGVLMLFAASQAFAAQTVADQYQLYYDDPKAPLQGYKYRWALGFDVFNQIMHPVNDFQYLTYNYRHGMEIYAAYRTRGPWGFELGYSWTTDKQKNISTVPGTVIFNTTATTTSEYQCKLRSESTYLDAYWHYKYRKIMEFKAGMGAGFERQNMYFTNPNQSTDPVAIMFSNLNTGTTIVARFNIGAQTMLTKRLGARALFNYKITSPIKAMYVPAGASSNMFANSYTVLVGLYYTITGYYD